MFARDGKTAMALMQAADERLLGVERDRRRTRRAAPHRRAGPRGFAVRVAVAGTRHARADLQIASLRAS